MPSLAGASDAKRPTVNGLVVTPATPGATVHPFGSGAQVERPGQPTRSVSPFGSGVIVTEPGKRDVVCTPFGKGTTCR
ncbi:MAG: hypothetical protein GEU87_01355 [Alphaproteobacteria bacterium]|nr:hypothetical protein [Alphaproteobacteria bacterium]